MKAIMDFVRKLGADFVLSADFTVEKAFRYFLLDSSLKELARRDFYYAGFFLGKVKGDLFFPSFNLLAMLAKGKANKIFVGKKAAWLFICGRDVFHKGVLTVKGSQRKGDYALVMNEFGECLGFGKIMRNIDGVVHGDEVTLKNISDVGDFLRREQ